MELSLNSIDGVIFDMDGLLLDTERIAMSSFVATCREFDFEPDLDIYVRCIGTNSTKVKEILTQGYGRDFPYEEIRKKWSQRYEQTILEHPVPRKPGASALLAFLKQRRSSIGLATSTKHASAVKKLKQADLYPYFDVIVGGDQVEKSKPDPEVYQTVSRLLETAPARCLALEDSDNGVLSAHGAGMMVIQIPDLRAPSRKIRDLGHPVLASLDDVRVLFEKVS
jgi:HAD superfamily hydrolase (TIGR01509 family)